jgi:hypothetical protein
MIPSVAGPTVDAGGGALNERFGAAAAGAAVAGDLEPATEPDIDEMAYATTFVLMRGARSTPKGLDEAEADRRLAAIGDNRTPPAVEPGPWTHLRTALLSPFAGITVPAYTRCITATDHTANKPEPATRRSTK